MLHFKRRLSRLVRGFLSSITKSKKPSVDVDGVKDYGERGGSSQTGLISLRQSRNHTNHVMEQTRRDCYFNLINENNCDQRKLFKTASALIGGSSQDNTPSTLALLCLPMILGDSLYKRSMSFAQSWKECIPH